MLAIITCKRDDQIRNAVILISSGAVTGRKWQILGVSVPLSDAGVHWMEFLQDLMAHSIERAMLVVSDDYATWRRLDEQCWGGGAVSDTYSTSKWRTRRCPPLA